MTIEAVQYISDLNTSYPRSTDLLREGDDHIRMVKASLKRTFPNINGAVQISSTALNDLNSQMQVSQAGLRLTKPFFVDGTATIRDDVRAGSFTTAGTVQSNAVEIYGGTPFVDFHFGNNGGDFTHRIIADSAARLNVSSDLHVNGAFGTDKSAQFGGSVGANSFSCPGDMTCNVFHGQALGVAQWITAARVQVGADTPTTPQGMHLGWNSPVQGGAGAIKVNRGLGAGGIIFEFLGNGGNREGLTTMDQNGTIRSGYDIYAAHDIHANSGTIYSGGDVWAGTAHLGTDGNIYRAGGWSGTGYTSLNDYINNRIWHRDPGNRLTGWSGVEDNSDIARPIITIDGSQFTIVPSHSDERLKENIEYQDPKLGFDRINSIPIKSFDWKIRETVDGNGDKHIIGGGHWPVGLIAQDIEKVIPEAVHTIDGNEDNLKQIEFLPMVANLVAAVQYLTKQVEELKAKQEA